MATSVTDASAALGVCSAAPPTPISFLASLPPGGGVPGMVLMAAPLVLTVLLLLYLEIPARPWHRALSKSPSAPPPAFHALAWLVCLVSTGWAARLVLTSLTGEFGEELLEDDVLLALGAFAVQLAIALSWPVGFFGMRRVVVGYAIMRAHCVAVSICVVAFARVNGLAASLLVPYLGWLIFLTYLNGYMARNNPPSGAIKKVESPPVVGGVMMTHPPSSRGAAGTGRRDVAALLRSSSSCRSRSPSCSTEAPGLSKPAPGACSPVTPVASAAPLLSCGRDDDDRDPLTSWDMLNESLPAHRSPPSTPVRGPCKDADWPPLPKEGDGAGAPGPLLPLQQGPLRPSHVDEAAGATCGGGWPQCE
eukprot:TRINITY_DN1430_c0_g1_i3.p1 TRINITY_DN1430_c0_g1~~TRINITY_DN1430_c0_g1_i3.p1  ORF type:complete len:363 (+),score=52.77 TRINITY_DN1430_c0_g1_i3:560-1648(+)